MVDWRPSLYENKIELVEVEVVVVVVVVEVVVIHGLRCSWSWLLPGALLAPSSLYHPCDDWMGEIGGEPLVMMMMVVVAVGVVVVGDEEEEGG